MTIDWVGTITDRRVDATELAETGDWGTLALDPAPDDIDTDGRVTWTIE